MRLALSSDITLYRTEQHRTFTVRTLDTTKEFQLSTCLDFYLDNVMANVPEFALALHTKGGVAALLLSLLTQFNSIPCSHYTIQCDALPHHAIQCHTTQCPTMQRRLSVT
jgi:hypothetical protein